MGQSQSLFDEMSRGKDPEDEGKKGRLDWNQVFRSTFQCICPGKACSKEEHLKGNKSLQEYTE